MYVCHPRLIYSCFDVTPDGQDPQPNGYDSSITDSAADTIYAIDDDRYITEVQATHDACAAAKILIQLSGALAEKRQATKELVPASSPKTSFNCNARRGETTTSTSPESISGANVIVSVTTGQINSSKVLLSNPS